MTKVWTITGDFAFPSERSPYRRQSGCYQGRSLNENRPRVT
jgi:hypothetical protein